MTTTTADVDLALADVALIVHGDTLPNLSLPEFERLIAAIELGFLALLPPTNEHQGAEAPAPVELRLLRLTYRNPLDAVFAVISAGAGAVSAAVAVITLIRDSRARQRTEEERRQVLRALLAEPIPSPDPDGMTDVLRQRAKDLEVAVGDAPLPPGTLQRPDVVQALTVLAAAGLRIEVVSVDEAQRWTPPA